MRGQSAEDNAVAELLRTWIDEAGLRVDDIRSRLTPDHFTDGRVPSRSTLSDRLAGVALREDFIEAVADVCSANDAARAQLLSAVRSARERGRSAGSASTARSAGVEAQLVIVQQRSIEVSDRLLRALDRQQQLERERNDANQMVLVLLAMVDKLQRDISSLARQRDRLHVVNPVEVQLQQVQDRLVRSEQQRTKAETELERAQAERRKADQLAEEAAEQVRLLTAELEELRSPAAGTDGDTDPTVSAPALREGLDIEADDIDLALSKATQHLDDRADRLDQIASELHLDNPPDNRLTTDDVLDNLVFERRSSFEHVTPKSVVATVRTLVSEGAQLWKVSQYFVEIRQRLSLTAALESAEGLRSAGLDQQAVRLLEQTVEESDPKGLPALIAALRARQEDVESHQLFSHLARRWAASSIVTGVGHLRAAEQDSDAYQVLSAVGRACPLTALLEVLQSVSSGDREWILDSAFRDRSSVEIADLRPALRRLGIDSGRTVAPPSAVGRTRQPSHMLLGETVVVTTAAPEQLLAQLPEHQRICDLCQVPRDIDAISEQLSVPLRVVKILAGDLIEAGLLAVAGDSRVVDRSVHSTLSLLRIERARQHLATSTSSPGTPTAGTFIGRGRSADLAALAPELKKLVVGVGWSGAGKIQARQYKVDASALATNGSGRVLSGDHIVYYSNWQSPDHTIIHTAKPVTPEDDATLLVEVSALRARGVRSVVFPLSIRRIDSYIKTDAWLRSAYVRILDEDSGTELARYNFPRRIAPEPAVISSELYFFEGGWKFRAVGHPYPSLRGIAEDYGSTVD